MPNWISEAAAAAHEKMPENYGMIILAVPFGRTGAEVVYASNLERADAILILKEWLIKCSGEDEWMKKIK